MERSSGRSKKVENQSEKHIYSNEISTDSAGWLKWSLPVYGKTILLSSTFKLQTAQENNPFSCLPKEVVHKTLSHELRIYKKWLQSFRA